MRLRDIGESQRRLLRELAGRISHRLDAEFVEPPGTGTESVAIGVTLRERGQSVLMELPEALLARAQDEPTAREAVRQRIKATRDRMLFRPPPPPLPKNIAAAGDPAVLRGGPGRGYGGGRGRR